MKVTTLNRIKRLEQTSGVCDLVRVVYGSLGMSAQEYREKHQISDDTLLLVVSYGA